MDRAEARLAAKIGVEYRGFLEKKGYVFDGEISLDGVYAGKNFSVHYEPSSGKHTVRLAGPIGIIHEMTHIVLKKDGLEPKRYAVGGGISREASENILKVYRGVLVSGVPDHYVDTLLLQFLAETRDTELGGWLKDYFGRKEEHVAKYFNEHLPDSAKALAGRRVFDEVSIFNYFLIGMSLFFKYSDCRMRGREPDGIDSAVKKLAKGYPHLSHFFANRYGLIKDFVDTLPSYGDLKSACAGSKGPLPTARLSMRLFNILYYGIDMESKDDVIEFAKLVRDGKEDALARLLREYGLDFGRGELKDANGLVKKMMDRDYCSFVGYEGERITFSPLLI